MTVLKGFIAETLPLTYLERVAIFTSSDGMSCLCWFSVMELHLFRWLL